MSVAVFLVLSVVFIGALYYFMFLSNKKGVDNETETTEEAGQAEEPEVVGGNNRRGAANRLRNRRATAAADDSDNSEEQKERFDQWAEDNDEDKDRVAAAGRGRFNKRDLQKQEKMNQRRQNREAMVQQREQQVKSNSDRDQKREEKERLREERDRQIEAEEQRIEDEKARKDQAEFDQWKALMQVQDSGHGTTQEEDEAVKTQKFIEFIQRRKVVLLEDVAAEFQMLAKDVVTKIEQLESDGVLSGITDDRGKYIHITPSEYQQVADFITAKGRVARSDLFCEANRLVRMMPTEFDREIIKQEQLACLQSVEKTIGSDKQ